MGKGLSPIFSLRRTIILGLLIGLSGVVIGFIPFVSSLEENIDLGLLFRGHRVVVWVILYFLEHTGKDFQSEILLVT
ncbi:MAG: hypothetical protein AYP45_17885 [Candidatus Brocadia carolinensis]|uniref:Uncharacterized protein n=1 Tax=Candidatus Brocadia carolinensis TaxID=1004156 RepID=A0A1V4AP56_9BACT|nr:MAG: hypothetical protein AYP45_17885 [Candidatus Brocadia caroliniensis]